MNSYIEIPFYQSRLVYRIECPDSLSYVSENDKYITYKTECKDKIKYYDKGQNMWIETANGHQFFDVKYKSVIENFKNSVRFNEKITSILSE